MTKLFAKRACALAMAACAVALAAPTIGQAATTQTFTTSQSEFTSGVRNQGWWSPTEFNEDINDNYLVSSSATVGAGGSAHRNFFTFDLSSACQASRVTLELRRFTQSGPLTYSLFDVSTPASTLNANDGTSQTIFTDLGTGTSFGSFLVANGADTDVLSFALNAAGVAAFNAARGGFFSVGGSIPDAATFYVFGFSEGTGTQQLVATCLPTATAECKNGGWRNFSGFKNQGECVSFVATGRKNPPAG
jgi:hypothetical protein